MPANRRNRLDELHRPALAVVSRYAAFGVAWIVLSDRLLAIAVPDPGLRELFQTLKGWFFIGVTAALLYGLVYRELAMRLSLRKAADAEPDEQEEQLRKALAEREALLAEVHHRVRNNLQVMESHMNLERRRVETDRDLAGFEGLRARIRAMSLVHDQLFRSGDFERVSMADYLESLLSHLCGTGLMCRYRISCGAATLLLDEAVPFGLLATELALNALEYAGSGAFIGVEAVEEADRIRVTFRDDGPGFPRGALEDKASIGLSLVESLASQLGGPVRFGNDGGARIDFSIVRRKGTEAARPPGSPESAGTVGNTDLRPSGA